MSVCVIRRLAPVLLLSLLALGCEPKEVEFKVKIITPACQGFPAPLDGANSLQVRVTGDGISPPLEATTQSLSEREIKISDIPSGVNRMVEVRAYAGAPDSGGRVVALGRSLPFNVPDTIPKKAMPEIRVFLRRVNAFTAPNSVLAPATCMKMGVPRAGHTATLLKNGKVLIAGGYQQQPDGKRLSLSSSELFNPETGVFEEGPVLGSANVSGQFVPLPMAFHTATLLPYAGEAGQVVIWGGADYGTADGIPKLWESVMIYDGDVNALGYIGKHAKIQRAFHSAALDASGRVLVVGGKTRVGAGPMELATAVEWLDPTVGEGKKLEGVTLPRLEMSMAPVQGGRYIAVAGGTDGTQLVDEVSLFSFDGNTFVEQAMTPPVRLHEARRAAGVATLRTSGDLLLVGGYTAPDQLTPVATSEIVKAESAPVVSNGPPVQSARGDICAATLPDGRVLAIGGRTADEGGIPRSDGTVELVVPQSDGSVTITGKDAIPGRYHHTCTTLADGSVLVLGGVREVNGKIEILQDALIFMPEPLDP